jgi:hypothetical protein
VGSFTDTFVSYGQLQVAGDGEIGNLPLFAVGDGLLSLTGASTVTVFAGLHTGTVRVRVLETAGPPDPDESWEAESEATLWSRTGGVSVTGLMSGPPEGFDDVVRGGPGLYRVLARARHRRREGPGYDDLPPEEFELVLWRVDVDTGIATTRGDALDRLGDPDAAQAAAWAARRIVAVAAPPPEWRNLRTLGGRRPLHDEGPHPRAAVRRHRAMADDAARAAIAAPAGWLGAVRDGGELVVPMGPLAIRLRPLEVAGPAAARLGWRWTAVPGSTAEPADDAESTVVLRLLEVDGATSLAVAHDGVRGADAVLIGLLWEHLLERAESPGAAGPPAWVAPLAADERQAREAAEADHRAAEERVRAEWGGRLPSPRLRSLPANVWGLRQLDPDLLFALDAAADDRLRLVARWAARRGLAIAGLDGVGWIADLMAGVERGEQPPYDLSAAFESMWADESVPYTVVAMPGGPPNALQQAMVLPAIYAAAEDDALAAAVNAVYATAIAHGPAYAAFLAELRDEFTELRA